MRLETKLKLLEKYNNLSNPINTTAIKYYFVYNGVNVNIYFDAYDSYNLSLSLVLALDKEYYYTSLNIDNNDIKVEYLENIPNNILIRILDENNSLLMFFDNVEKHIMNTDSIIINYNSDKDIFARTLKYNNKERKDLPFIKTKKRANMTDKTFNNLRSTMGISIEALNAIRNQNMTLVRTSDPAKRKNITIILEELNIHL